MNLRCCCAMGANPHFAAPRAGGGLKSTPAGARGGRRNFETSLPNPAISGVPYSVFFILFFSPMAANLSTCHPGDGIEALNRLPGLAQPLLQIDFEPELQQLRREDS
jgi:hypothetical protein